MNIRDRSFIAGLAAVLCVLFLCPLFFSPGAASAASAEENRYAVTLVSSPKPIDISTIPRLEAFNIYTLYISTHEKRGATWYRLRLGFFPDKGSADEVAKSLKAIFTDGWSSKVTVEEKKLSAALKVNWSGEVVKSKKKGELPIVKMKALKAEDIKSAPPRGTGKKAKSLMGEAEKAMTGGKHLSAIKLYKEVLSLPAHKYRQSAQELLALAYERSGDYRRARSEYRAYLLLYPEGEDAERVRQRLSALETARAEPKERLRKPKEKEKSSTEVYGSFSQFYHHEENYTDLGGNDINRLSLSSDMDLTVRRKVEDFEHTLVLILGYEQDFLNSGDENKTYLSRIYYDLLDRNRELSLRLGRQSRSSGGVLGRFDGAHFSYQVASQVNLNLVAGYPVNSAVFEKFETNKHFYGVNFDVGTIFDYWDFNFFMIRQVADGMLDREAVGMESRYFHPKRSFFMILDFDTSYNVLNTLLMSANMKLSDITTVNMFMDIRRSPILTTSNALQGQAVDSLDDLSPTYTEDEIRALAFDRTAQSRSLLVGITRELTSKVQISGDVTISELTDTPASGGVEAMQGTGYEYFVSTQLVGSGLIKEGDTAILGLRLASTASSNSLTADVNTRYPLTRDLRFNPRLRIDYSWELNNSANRIEIRPSLRVDYYFKKDLKFEFDGGVEWGNELTSGMGNDTRDYFFTFGYRKNF
ncbi:MAG: SPOR domain-containing protein [Proteobacteria bacterium]|nr:SPOR domain-containing protein [Pseudomonadota bacterium]